MSKKRLFIILLFLVIALGTISSASASQNESAGMEMAADDDLALSDSGDVLGDGDSGIANTTPKSFTDLNNAINGNNDKNVYLKDNYKFNSSSDSGFEDGIVIKRAVTVWGNGVTIDGSHLARIFNLKNSKVVFHDIVFVNGNSNGDEISESGGAISGKCSAFNCTFNNNVAGWSGGAIDYGSAVNCTFNNNVAGWSGGAMFGGSAVNCTFNNNHAKDEGGAIYGYDGRSVVNCTFNNNSAGKGGAVYFYDDGSVVNCFFMNNSAGKGGAILFYDGGSAVNCTFNNNHANNEGGAMFGGSAVNSTFNNNSARVSGAMHKGSAATSTFTYNSAKEGGAIANGKANNCIFNYNRATAYGGAVYSSKVLTNCKFNNNSAPKGKNVYLVTWLDPARTFTGLNKLINNNKAKNIYLKGNYIFDSSADSGLKGGIEISRSVTIWGNGFTINAENGARIFKVTKGNVVFRNVTFANARTKGNGGAICGKCKAIGCTFKNNEAKRGGAMYGGSAVSCIFNGNKAITYYGAGGAMYRGSAVNCIFNYNKAYSGGAMYRGSAVNCIFNNNDVYSGGAMYRGSAVKCSFNCNSAKAFSGAMGGGSAVKCSFKDNSAACGGAMWDGTAVKCLFVGNFASSGGATGFSTAKNCKFIKNQARNYGGAMYEGRPIKCVFKSNKAGRFGDKLCKFTKIVSSDVSTVYKADKYIVATLKDHDNRAIRGVKVTIKVGNLKKTMKTDSKGQVKLSIKNLAPKSYTAEITCAGNQNYVESSKTVKVTVKKR